jgi:tRNA-splicing ligase RtcB (3'-phosphate/5'-hydroxy nucleic acid ligase)
MELERLDDHRWRLPRQGKMRVDGLIFADDTLIRDIQGDPAVEQVANVATLPGIVGHSIGMPDIHWGYGFPIGGVAAFDPEEGGVISPGGVGYDINCGVRLHRSNLTVEQVRPRLAQLMDDLFRRVPAGVGRGYRKFVLSPAEIRQILFQGAAWVVEKGLGRPEDLERMEDGGALGRGRPGPGESPGGGAGEGPGGDRGKRQPLHRGGVGGPGLRRRCGGATRPHPWDRHRLRPFRLPGAWGTRSATTTWRS